MKPIVIKQSDLARCPALNMSAGHWGRVLHTDDVVCAHERPGTGVVILRVEYPMERPTYTLEGLDEVENIGVQIAAATKAAVAKVRRGASVNLIEVQDIDRTEGMNT